MSSQSNSLSDVFDVIINAFQKLKEQHAEKAPNNSVAKPNQRTLDTWLKRGSKNEAPGKKYYTSTPNASSALVKSTGVTNVKFSENRASENSLSVSNISSFSNESCTRKEKTSSAASSESSAAAFSDLGNKLLKVLQNPEIHTTSTSHDLSLERDMTSFPSDAGLDTLSQGNAEKTVCSRDILQESLNISFGDSLQLAFNDISVEPAQDLIEDKTNPDASEHNFPKGENSLQVTVLDLCDENTATGIPLTKHIDQTDLSYSLKEKHSHYSNDKSDSLMQASCETVTDALGCHREFSQDNIGEIEVDSDLIHVNTNEEILNQVTNALNDDNMTLMEVLPKENPITNGIENTVNCLNVFSIESEMSNGNGIHENFSSISQNSIESETIVTKQNRQKTKNHDSENTHQSRETITIANSYSIAPVAEDFLNDSPLVTTKGSKRCKKRKIVSTDENDYLPTECSMQLNGNVLKSQCHGEKNIGRSQNKRCRSSRQNFQETSTLKGKTKRNVNGLDSLKNDKSHDTDRHTPKSTVVSPRLKSPNAKKSESLESLPYNLRTRSATSAKNAICPRGIKSDQKGSNALLDELTHKIIEDNITNICEKFRKVLDQPDIQDIITHAKKTYPALRWAFVAPHLSEEGILMGPRLFLLKS